MTQDYEKMTDSSIQIRMERNKNNNNAQMNCCNKKKDKKIFNGICEKKYSFAKSQKYFHFILGGALINAVITLTKKCLPNYLQKIMTKIQSFEMNCIRLEFQRVGKFYNIHIHNEQKYDFLFLR